MGRWEYLTAAYFILEFLILILGIQSVPLNFQVDPEYITGILTASSILFGFWFVVIERTIGGRGGKITYKKVLRVPVVSCLIFLAASVVAVFFAALNVLPTLGALLLSLATFLNILIVLIFTLWEFPFRG